MHYPVPIDAILVEFVNVHSTTGAVITCDRVVWYRGRVHHAIFHKGRVLRPGMQMRINALKDGGEQLLTVSDGELRRQPVPQPVSDHRGMRQHQARI